MGERRVRWVLLIAVLAVLVGCGDSALTEAEYVEKAKSAMDRGDYRESIIHLKNTLANYPESSESRFLLGDIYVRLGNGGGGEKELKKALEFGVVKEAVYEGLADALLIQGKSGELIQQFKVSQNDSKELKVKKLVALGDAYFQERKFGKAADSYRSALFNDKTSIRAQLGIVRLNIVNGLKDEAVELIGRVVEQEGKSPLVWLARADVYKAVENMDEVLVSFEKAASYATSKQDYYYFVGMRGQIEQHLQKNATGKAKQVLEKLTQSFYKEQLPDMPAINHLRGVLAFQSAAYDKALEFSGKVLTVVPDHYGAILVFGASNALIGHYEQAENYLQRFLAVAPRHLGARKMLAYVQLNSSSPKSAVETLKPIENAALDAQTLALVATAALQAGDAVKGAQYFEKALVEHPESSAFRGGLARSYVGLGEYDKALGELGRVRELSSDKARASLAIVETLIKAKKYQAALMELDQLEKTGEDKSLYISLKGTVYLQSGKVKQAISEFERALVVKPGFSPAARNLALLALKEKNTMKAESYFNAILKENPDDTATMYDYAQLKIQRKAYLEAETLIKNASHLDKDKVRNAVLLARLYLQSQEPAKALAELRELQSMEVKINSAVFAEQGNAQMMLGEYVNALSSYKKLLALESSSETAHYLVYTSQAALGRQSEASLSLDSALALNSKFLPALIGKAGILLLSQKIKEAEHYIVTLEAIAPNNVEVQLLVGELAMYQGKAKKAVSIYTNLYKDRPLVSILQRLSQAYWEAGNKEEAISLLIEGLNKQPNNAHLNFIVATAYQGVNNEDKAIEFYRKAIALNEQHVLALNNLAWLLMDRDSQAALVLVKKAIVLAPKNASLLDTLNQIQALTNR